MAVQLYALIDCASDERLYPLVTATPGHSCLYAGEIQSDLAPAAPWIAPVSEGDALLRAMRTDGCGQNWGILCESNLPLTLVRFHFRHFLQARLPDKRIVEFRFYDPRVFRVYLPTCTSDELVRWFDGITRFLVEGENGATMMSYTIQSGQLIVRPVR